MFARRHQKLTTRPKRGLIVATRFLGRVILLLSNVHRLRNSDRIFFITANLSENLPHLTKAEFAGLLGILTPLAAGSDSCSVAMC